MKNYVSMWHKNSLLESERTVNVRSDNYLLQNSGNSGKILKMAVAGTVDEQEFFNGPDTVETNFFFYTKVGGTVQKVYSDRVEPYTRIIESGRILQRMDTISVHFPETEIENIRGNFEVASLRNHFALRYALYLEEDRSVDVFFSLKFREKMQFIPIERGVKFWDEHGNGFACIKQKFNYEIQIFARNNTLYCGKNAIYGEAHRLNGISVLMIPIREYDETLLEQFFATEAAEVRVVSSNGETEQISCRYDDCLGCFRINTDALCTGSMMQESNHNNAERLVFEVVNHCNIPIEPVILFEKTRNSKSSISGFTPMLRDTQSGKPTGEPVQISKNWHRHSSDPDRMNYSAEDGLERHFEGGWIHNLAQLYVKPNESLQREYLCTYAKWGTTYAISYAQLCLIGWGGNQVWEQAALGSFGESITYDPDMCLGRGAVDDVRPFLVLSQQGNKQKFTWTGNVGGADFLTYYPKGIPVKVADQKIYYISQGPNLSQTRYEGTTSDGVIAASYEIWMGRTDDVPRAFFKIRYTFEKDCSYQRLALFKLCADNYSNNHYTKYAYGDETGAYEQDLDAKNVPYGYIRRNQQAKGNRFWFALYDSSQENENGNVMFTVREYRENVNGNECTSPHFSFFGTNDQMPQMSCELTVPEKKIQKGSTVEMLVEFAVLPAREDIYYGTSRYLTENREIIGTADACLQQAVGGTVSANATVGTVVSAYPVCVRCDSSDAIVADVCVRGGLGYVPLVFDGLERNTGYHLEIEQKDTFVKVDQSVLGEDYYQVDTNEDGSYRFVYNVENESGQMRVRLVREA